MSGENTESEVLPCPFCGEMVEMIFREGEWGYTSNMIDIQCKDCRVGFSETAETWEPGKGTYSIREQAEQKVLARWNTRHNFTGETE